MNKTTGWSNFLYYASLIKFARCHGNDIEPGLLPFLYTAIKDRSPILCSLKEMSWNEGGKPSSDLLFLVGKHLQRLYLTVPDSSNRGSTRDYRDWLLRLTDRLGSVSPNLKILEINAFPGFPYDFECDAYFHTLHGVEVRLVHEDGGCRLSSFHSTCANGGRSSSTVDTAALTPRFLPLAKFRANSETGGPYLRIVVEVLRSRIGGSLRAISLSSSSARWDPDEPSFLQFVRPLLNLHQVQDVWVDLTRHFLEFPDHDLIEMATAWPALRQLSLTFRPASRDTTLNFHIIGDLVRLCPSLKSCTLPSMKIDSIIAFRLCPPPSLLNELIVTSLFMPNPEVNYEAISAATKEAFPALKLLVLICDERLVRMRNHFAVYTLIFRIRSFCDLQWAWIATPRGI